MLSEHQIVGFWLWVELVRGGESRRQLRVLLGDRRRTINKKFAQLPATFHIRRRYSSINLRKIKKKLMNPIKRPLRVGVSRISMNSTALQTWNVITKETTRRRKFFFATQPSFHWSCLNIHQVDVVFWSRNCATGAESFFTYAELIADFGSVWEWLGHGVVRGRWLEGLQLWVVLLFILDSFLQASRAAQADLLLLYQLNEPVLVLENASQKMLEGEKKKSLVDLIMGRVFDLEIVFVFVFLVAGVDFDEVRGHSCKCRPHAHVNSL